MFQSLALGAVAYVPPGQGATVSPDALRHVAEAHGIELSDARLQVLMPVLERRQSQLKTLRGFELDDTDGLV